MKILCGAFTKNGVFLREMALVEDFSLAIPFLLYSMESEEVVSFDLIEHIVLIGDMSKDVPDTDFSDFVESTRLTQKTIDRSTWRKVKRELKQRGVYLHERL
jgi:hypothetical protein